MGIKLETQFEELKKLSDILNNVQIANKRTRDMAFQRQTLISEMFRATARAKLSAVSEYIKGIIQDNPNQKIIVYGFHQIILDSIQTVCEELKESFIRIDGKTPQQERQAMVDRFQDSTGARIAVLSIGACNSGLTLTACNYMIFAELNWVPGILQQCEDRIHRIGQEHPCNYDYLVAKDTLDERVMKKIQGKFSLLDHILNSSENADGFDVTENGQFERSDDDEAEPSSPKRTRK